MINEKFCLFYIMLIVDETSNKKYELNDILDKLMI